MPKMESLFLVMLIRQANAKISAVTRMGSGIVIFRSHFCHPVNRAKQDY
jgi:hypothetical protein